MQRIQFEHHDSQHNKRAERQQFRQSRDQIDAGCRLYAAQDEEMDNPEQD